MGDHRLLTVRHPWAWAIVHGYKDVENRTGGAARWRRAVGPLWIHSALTPSRRGDASPLVRAARLAHRRDRGILGNVEHLGAVVGHVTVADVHDAAPGCCDSPWAEHTYHDADERQRTGIVHLVLQGATSVAAIRATGRLGLWRPDPDLAAELDAAMPPATLFDAPPSPVTIPIESEYL